MATEYKKVNLTNVHTRTNVALSSGEQTRVNEVISKFFELFAAEHS